MAFSGRGQQDRVEADRAQSVVGFLQADLLIGERVGDVERPLAKAERATRGDGLDEEVARVVRDRQPRRIRTR